MRWGWRWFIWGSAWFSLLRVGWWIRGLDDAEMEKEKKKFNLSRLLRIHLRKKSKSLQCNSCRSPPAAGNSAEFLPAPRNTWTVKSYLLSIMEILEWSLRAVLLRSGISKWTSRGVGLISADETCGYCCWWQFRNKVQLKSLHAQPTLVSCCQINSHTTVVCCRMLVFVTYNFFV